MSTELAAIAQQYREHSDDLRGGRLVEELRAAADVLNKRHVTALLDALAVAAAISSFQADTAIDIGSLPQPVVEAFEAAYPNVDLSNLDGATNEAVAGYLNAWQGKLFEISVRDELNAGEPVGDWLLAPGQTAELAASATQTGWDLAVRDESGALVDVIQLKATESASYVREALDRYPDIPILTTSDVGGSTEHLVGVSAAEISTEDLHQQISVEDAGVGVLDGIDAADAFVPATVIFATELLAVFTGSKSPESAMASALGRSIDSGIATAVGVAVSALTFGAGGVAAGVLTRILLLKRRRASVIKANGKPASVQPMLLKTTPKVSGAAVSPATRVMPQVQQGAGTARQLGFTALRNVVARLHRVYGPQRQGAAATSTRSDLREEMLWAGVIIGTGEEVVFDPQWLRAEDHTVWLFSVDRKLMRCFDRSSLRPWVRKVQSASHGTCLARYNVWKARNATGFAFHLERHRRVANYRPAFRGDVS